MPLPDSLDPALGFHHPKSDLVGSLGRPLVESAAPAARTDPVGRPLSKSLIKLDHKKALRRIVLASWIGDV
jgi:hypothetical protein